MTEKQKRTVFAPQPAVASSSPRPTNYVISVELDDDEDVEWIWSSSSAGTRYISGYTVIKQQS